MFVVDQHDVIRYAAYMPKLGDQPDYDQVMATARGLLAADGSAAAGEGAA